MMSKSSKMGHFTIDARRSLVLAQDYAEEYGHKFIYPEHMLLAMTNEELSKTQVVLEQLGIIQAKLLPFLKQVIFPNFDKQSDETLRLSNPIKNLLQRAVHEARNQGAHKITMFHLLLGLCDMPSSTMSQIFEHFDLTNEAIRRYILDYLGIYEDVSRNHPLYGSKYFSDEARYILKVSQDIAEEYHHGTITVGHVFLAMTRATKCHTHTILENLDIVESKLIPFLKSAIFSDLDVLEFVEAIGFNDDTKLLLQLAVNESNKLGSENVLSFHLLLGITQLETPLVGAIFDHFDLDREFVREITLVHIHSYNCSNSKGCFSGNPLMRFSTIIRRLKNNAR